MHQDIRQIVEEIRKRLLERIRLRKKRGKTIDSYAKPVTIKSRETIGLDSGRGQGNFGHKGIPGHRGGSLPQASAGAISNAIKSGKISTKLNRNAQSKHHKGSAKYNKAVERGEKVGYFNVDDNELQELINKHAGTGVGYTNGKQYKEVVDVGKVIGVHASKTGVMRETTKMTIHYGEKNCHAVPASP